MSKVTLSSSIQSVSRVGKRVRRLIRMALPSVCPTIVVPYRFRVWRYDFANVVFLVTAILIPLFLTGLQSFLPRLGSVKWLIVLGSCAVGVVYLWVKGRMSVLVRTGAVAFYLYALAPLPISLLELLASGSTWIIVWNILIDLLVFATTLILAPTLRTKIRLTFVHADSRRQLLYLPFFMLVGFGVIMLFDFWQNQINPGGHAHNEDILDQILNSGRWGDVLLVVMLILVVAPLTEELVARHALIQLTGLPSLGFLTSVVWFSAIHISDAADWINIMGYLGGALVLTGVFFFFNYNVVFSVIGHCVINCVAVVSNFM